MDSHRRNTLPLQNASNVKLADAGRNLAQVDDRVTLSLAEVQLKLLTRKGWGRGMRWPGAGAGIVF